MGSGEMNADSPTTIHRFADQIARRGKTEADWKNTRESDYHNFEGGQIDFNQFNEQINADGIGMLFTMLFFT